MFFCLFVCFVFLLAKTDTQSLQWVKVGSLVTYRGVGDGKGTFALDRAMNVYGVRYTRRSGGISCTVNQATAYWGCNDQKS